MKDVVWHKVEPEPKRPQLYERYLVKVRGCAEYPRIAAWTDEQGGGWWCPTNQGAGEMLREVVAFAELPAGLP